ncbi:MAG: hypothetical protein ACPGVK_05525, partial [Halocynthiibacter sp.]
HNKTDIEILPNHVLKARSKHGELMDLRARNLVGMLGINHPQFAGFIELYQIYTNNNELVFAGGIAAETAALLPMHPSVQPTNVFTFPQSEGSSKNKDLARVAKALTTKRLIAE